MITVEMFKKNFEILQSKIPTKPLSYTSDYPKNITESFEKYIRRSSLHTFEAATKSYNDQDWPIPLWIDPNNIRIGFINRLNYNKTKYAFKKKNTRTNYWDWFSPYSRIIRHWHKIHNSTDLWDVLYFPHFNQVFFQQNFEEGIVIAFDCNIKFIKTKLESNPLLSDKKKLIGDIISTYNKGYWAACITTLFPILDHLSRKFLRVTNLKSDIKKICNLFKECGFGQGFTDNLMPHTTLSMKLVERSLGIDTTKTPKDLYNEIKFIDLGLIGPLLSSFLKFANSYYEYYKDENDQGAILNRHAILHGSITGFGNKVNAAKLITFLYLFVELEPVFNILFDE